MRDEDGVGRDGLVEGAGDGADDAQGLGERDVGEVDGDALGGVVGVEEDVEAGELADGLVDVLDVFDEVEGDGLVGGGLKGDGPGDGGDLAQDLMLLGHLLGGRGGGGPAEAWGRLIALGAFDLLLGGLVGWVDLGGAQELLHGPG